MALSQLHHVPSTSWIETALALPASGQSVEFMLAERDCPIVGTFDADGFRSRWTRYSLELVWRWRGAIGPQTAPN
jgi:hypothetical protein